ncbi:MAG: sporulation transcriptional regulator SpoIIID [Ruminococcaceae bacterium]|nr:sporulation transcriptional regulator SpoIIID [Oscillospiraceae bacterium]
MKDYISDRVILLAEYIIENKATVRKAAKQFNISKSTVHKDITERLLLLNAALAKKAKEVLEENKANRHIRGGMATKQKYQNEKRMGA